MSAQKDPADVPEKPKAPADPIDTRLVRRLADILKDTGLTQIEVERGDLKIRVAREVTVAAAQTVYAPAPQMAAPAPAAAPAPVAAAMKVTVAPRLAV